MREPTMMEHEIGRRRMVAEPTLLTFKEAMGFLRVSRSTLYRLMWAGQVRGHKVGSTWRFYQQDLLGALATPVTERSTERSAESMPRPLRG
jgi:excisionase family DNA binding protein